MNSGLESALSIADLRRLARRALPRVLFDYLEGGVEDESGLARNAAAFQQFAFAPRYLRDVGQVQTAATLLGGSYALPFGIAPTGLAGLLRPQADLLLVRAAAQRGIPFILSGVGSASLEEVHRNGPRNTWFQLYPTVDKAVAVDVVRRAARAGIEHLVCTVDIPVTSKRERDLRNGFGLSSRPTLRGAVDALLHPGWLLRFLRSGGLPFFETWRPYAAPNASAMQVAGFMRTQSPAQMSWDDVRELRDRWRGKLILKGIMHPDDAARAIDLGVDGIIVSNHGGRQLDLAGSSLSALCAVRRAVGRAFPLMLDSGVRRGSDIAMALCLGADFVFVGRSTLYGTAVAGQHGAQKAIDILSDELMRVLRQLGARDVRELDASFLMATTTRDGEPGTR